VVRDLGAVFGGDSVSPARGTGNGVWGLGSVTTTVVLTKSLFLPATDAILVPG